MSAAVSQDDGEGLKVIHAALFRMGTKSMALAYQQLGYRVHHGLLEGVLDTDWAGLEKAAEATWPDAPGARPRPRHTRADWDALWGRRYDAVTDLASPFALELIRAYPEAKVVMVRRDFDRWWPSFQTAVLDPVTKEPFATAINIIATHILRLRGMPAMRKTHFGFFGATTAAEVRRNAPAVLDEYAALPPRPLGGEPCFYVACFVGKPVFHSGSAPCSPSARFRTSLPLTPVLQGTSRKCGDSCRRDSFSNISLAAGGSRCVRFSARRCRPCRFLSSTRRLLTRRRARRDCGSCTRALPRQFFPGLLAQPPWVRPGGIMDDCELIQPVLWKPLVARLGHQAPVSSLVETTTAAMLMLLPRERLK